MQFDKSLFYNIIGRMLLWGLIILFALYIAYDTGHQDGKLEGYWRGYSDGFFRLKPADPNLSAEERAQIQKLKPSPIPKQNRDTVNHGRGILVSNY